MTLKYQCVSCAMTLFPLHAANHIDTPPSFGDLLICGACGNINKVTLTGTALLSDEELAKLSEDEQKDLKFAQRAVRQHRRKQ